MAGRADRAARREHARRQAVLTGRRELVGQVLEDVVRSVISPTEAERRLAAYGLDLAGAHIVVLGTPVQEVAHLTNDHLAHVGAEPRVGVGGSYGGVHGLRWSFFEAREAQARGPGVNDREPRWSPSASTSTATRSATG